MIIITNNTNKEGARYCDCGTTALPQLAYSFTKGVCILSCIQSGIVISSSKMY